MSGHAFHEIYLHFNWHVEENRQIITPEMESLIYEKILNRCRAIPGFYPEGVGGTETHVHLAGNIEPTVLISDTIGKIKGGSSHDVNETLGYKYLDWRRGYGVVSFSKRDLPWVLAYIANQKEHHQRGTENPKLEIYDFLE